MRHIQLRNGKTIAVESKRSRQRARKAMADLGMATAEVHEDGRPLGEAFELAPNRYTTRGRVRGSCGHKHHSMRWAVRCMIKDQRVCATLRGYSDRDVVRVDGLPFTLEESEMIDDLVEQEIERMSS